MALTDKEYLHIRAIVKEEIAISLSRLEERAPYFPLERALDLEVKMLKKEVAAITDQLTGRKGADTHVV